MIIKIILKLIIKIYIWRLQSLRKLVHVQVRLKKRTLNKTIVYWILEQISTLAFLEFSLILSGSSPVRIVAPSSFAKLTYPETLARCSGLIKAPIHVSLSSGSPTVIVLSNKNMWLKREWGWLLLLNLHKAYHSWAKETTPMDFTTHTHTHTHTYTLGVERCITVLSTDSI